MVKSLTTAIGDLALRDWRKNPRNSHVFNMAVHCDELPSRRVRFMCLWKMPLPPKREAATPASTGVIPSTWRSKKYGFKAFGFSPEKTQGKAYPLDMTSTTVCRRGLHIVSRSANGEIEEVQPAGLIINAKLASLTRTEFLDAFEDERFNELRKKVRDGHDRALEPQKFIDNIFPPKMASALVAGLGLDDDILFVCFEFYSGVSGFFAGVLDVFSDAISFAYDSLLACGAFHKAALGDSGDHEFTQCVLGPQDLDTDLDIGDGRGKRVYQGCGYDAILKDVESKLAKIRERYPGRQIHVHGHFSPPCNLGHPMHSAGDYPDRRFFCRMLNHWTYESADAFVAGGIFQSASFENGKFCREQWRG